ncbi:hypothetical protein GCM10027517_03150 [Phycicoccus ginsengisoli]
MSVFTNPRGPFERAAEHYRDAGMGPVSLPRKAKSEPVAGWTGEKHRGVYADTDADLRYLAAQRPKGNVGLRLPEDLVGIDVDVRDGGDQTVAFLEIDLGGLPPTLHSTSRDDGSRIAFYRVPAGLRWKDVGTGVQTVWWGHRYAVVWPSVHPDTGREYHWYDADGDELPGAPQDGWASAADLPAGWVDELTKDAAPAEPVAAAPLRADGARVRRDGMLRWLRASERGERNARINGAAYFLGGLWARLPEDLAVEDLSEDALQDAVRDVFEAIGVPADEHKANDTLRRGWEAGVRDPGEATRDRPWDGGRRDAADDFSPAGPGPRAKLSIDVTNPDDAYKEACRVLGTGSMAGVFRRDDSLVHTPRIDEDGYVPLTDNRKDEDGPAQVRRLDLAGLRAFMAHNADLFKLVTPRGGHGPEPRSALLPADVAGLLVAAPRYVEGARPLRAVVHTPVVLADCSVLSTPGYHDATGVMLLPELEVPVPSGDVTGAQADAAVALLDLLLEGFPFETPDDRATYLAALLTPLLREVVPPPYPLTAIGAPTPGSGKSYLAWIMRELHGGVFRAELPRSDEELRKQITSILDQTSAPVVTFDNLSGVFRSARFDGLLTSDVWSDRPLGETREVSLANDRVWTVTGNNLQFGGDMRRRVRWVTIDAKMAHPEARTGFKIDLKPWVRAHRGELLGALLTLVVGWCQAGRPVPAPERSDDFTRWTQVTQGILDWAGVKGTVGGSERDGGTEDADDGDVLDALFAFFGTRAWTAGDAVREAEFGGELADVIPRPAHGGRPNDKTLGRWLARWQDRPTEGGLVLRKRGRRWWFEPALSAEDLALL